MCNNTPLSQTISTDAFFFGSFRDFPVDRAILFFVGVLLVVVGVSAMLVRPPPEQYDGTEMSTETPEFTRGTKREEFPDLDADRDARDVSVGKNPINSGTLTRRSGAGAGLAPPSPQASRKGGVRENKYQ